MKRQRSEWSVPPARRSAAAWTALAFWLGLLIWLVYGRALALPFFADDFFQLPFVDAHELLELWRSADGLFYFRPLAFTVWKVLHLAVGGHSTVLLHSLNLLLHWANGLFVAWIVGQLWATKAASRPASEQRRLWVRRFLSATLFILFPFSYEAVAWVAAVMHPMMLFLTLLSVAAYLQWSATGSRFWLAVGLVTALLSPFAHENGALLFGLVVALAFVHHVSTAGAQRSWYVVLLWAIPTLIWFAVWRQVPAADGAGTLAINSPETVWRNTLYVAQGLAYPLSWLGGALRDQLQMNEVHAAFLLNNLALLLAIITLWRNRERMDARALLPWLWVALSVGPAILLLPYEHLSAGPRILMLASVGIAMLWTDVILYYLPNTESQSSPRLLRIALPASLIAGLLLQNGWFVREQMEIYELGGSAIRQATKAATSANATGLEAVFINFPSWIAPPRATYALGQEGDIFVLSGEQIDDMIWSHTGQVPQTGAFDYADVRSQVPYHNGVVSGDARWAQWSSNGAQLFLARYEPEAIRLEAVGRFEGPSSVADPQAQFGEQVLLEALTAEGAEGWVQVQLQWQVTAPVSPGITAFVHVLDASGQLIGQADGDPFGGTYSFDRWPGGQMARDQRTIHVQGTPHTVHVGLYERATGARLRAISANGAPLDANAVAVPVSILPEAQSALLP